MTDRQDQPQDLVPSLDPLIEVVDVYGEVVLWHWQRREAHVLDAISSALVPYFDGVTTVHQMVDDVADVFDVSRRDARSAIQRLAEKLSALGVVEDLHR